MVGFRLDEQGDWVARLECGHSQHVRHLPPFQERSWVLDDCTRRERLGSPLECPLCDRGELPDDLEAVRSTPTWDDRSVPPALRSEHRLAAGVWGQLVVESGSVDVQFAPAGEEASDGGRQSVEAGGSRGIPPQAPHRVEVVPGSRFHLDIFRLPPMAEPEDEGGDSPCLAHRLCPECGIVQEPGAAHRAGCPAGEASGP